MPPLRVLIQASIPYRADDWNVGRFSLLAAHLAALRDIDGTTLVSVVTRNREPDSADRDPFLLGLSRTDFDEVWLLGVDGGVGLNAEECGVIDAFQAAGGGVLTARDHQDMGLWLRNLRCMGNANCYHEEAYREPDPSRWQRDDSDNLSIDFPNYHSGANGDFQRILHVEPLHPLLSNAGSSSGLIEYLPAHPHEGAVRPSDNRSKTVARGTSKTTGQVFDLAVAFERSADFSGRGVAESSFHHFTDYNWDLRRGAPSFVTEAPGNGMELNPRALADTKAYVRNLVRWLAPATT